MFGSFAQRMVDGQGLTQPLLEQDQGRRRHDRGMVHRRLPFKLNVERTGLSFWRLIFSDVFQYLLDMPLWRFVIVVFISYA